MVQYCSTKVGALFYLVAGFAFVVASSFLLLDDYAVAVFVYIGAGTCMLFGGTWDLSSSLIPSEDPAQPTYSRSKLVRGLLRFLAGLSFLVGAVLLLPDSPVDIYNIGFGVYIFGSGAYAVGTCLSLLLLLLGVEAKLHDEHGNAGHDFYCNLALLLFWLAGSVLFLAGAVLALFDKYDYHKDIWMTASACFAVMGCLNFFLQFFDISTEIWNEHSTPSGKSVQSGDW